MISSSRSPIRWESFFFSSRRRHTRSDRDWSSDVCSSDLLSSRRCRWAGGPGALCRGGHALVTGVHGGGSGERRGGEEGRSRGGADHLKKKDIVIDAEIEIGTMLLQEDNKRV